MQIIPSIDIREASPRLLVDRYPDRAQSLIAASRRTFGPVSDLIAHALLPPGDRVSQAWLRETNNPYLDEIDYYAKRLKTKGVYAFNICFEWGCTSSVYVKPEGPVLTRVLDWAFPRLGAHLVVAHQRGPAGDFYNVTWPGISGMFQGLAPQRFAATLNQAPMRRHGLTLIGDWVKNRRAVFRGRGLPPAHLLRQVFEEAASFDEAKARLATTTLAVPVIYILAGVTGDQACVIERTENDYAIRDLDQGRVCAANQFDSWLNETGSWWPRPIDSAGRARLAHRLTLAEIDDDLTWFKPPIANAHSRLVMMAKAATGGLSVAGVEGAAVITQKFEMP